MKPPSRDGKGIGTGGVGLQWRIWDAQEPCGRLLLVHGLGEHSGRYGDFARHLAQNGFSVFSFDLRGHGVSEGTRGDTPAFSDFLDDLRAMEGVMEGQLAMEGPTYLMGHSLGGLIALGRLREGIGPYHGAILSAPWLRTALPGWVRALGRWIGGRFPRLSLPSGLSPWRLSRDPEMVQAWKDDPLNHPRLSGRLFRAAEELQEEVLAHPALPDLPLLFLIPGDDPVVEARVTEKLARGIVGKAVAIEILEGRVHEPLNDLGRQEVYDLVTSWLQTRSIH
jgi:alpha-beta hydrolase superfamily lysophospholipase